MRLIPVLDIADGRAVHARGGRREAYTPVVSQLTPTPGDAMALARAYVETLGAREIYIADLDAIAGRLPNEALVRSVAALGAEPWVDAGVTGTARAEATIEAGAARVIVGLETLPSVDALAGVARAIGDARTVFSLDLRNGVPIARTDSALRDAPVAVTQRAIDAGARTVIVLDLARVGTSAGVDLALIAELRRAHPGIELVAGGGVRGVDDLVRLADAGCDAALVATALHQARVTRADIDAVRGHTVLTRVPATELHSRRGSASAPAS
ncbi:MAG TPA: HisA/HisF-related TIM barrel protein [Gemmatimonadaceae bacterium]|nr:HisA/HisF-related TIM barrel protein [Gemmatimonadaceae bacterium]